MVNKVILVGNLGKDPEGKDTPSGKRVCRFPLATEDWDGAKKTSWHNIVCWEKQADVCEKYLKKGSRVYLEGRISYESWGDGDNKKYRTDIKVDNVRLMGGKKDSAPTDTPAEDDLPF